MQSDLERTLYGEQAVTFCPAGLNVPNSATIMAIFLAPFTGTITHFSIGYGVKSSGEITVATLCRGSTVLVTLATTAANVTVISSGVIGVAMSFNETLNIKLTATNATDKFNGLTAQLRFRRALATG